MKINNPDTFKGRKGDAIYKCGRRGDKEEEVADGGARDDGILDDGRLRW